MRTGRTSGVAVALVCAIAANTRADDVAIRSTGVDDASAVLAPAAQDAHYAIVQGPSGFVPRQATVARAHPSFVPNDPVGTVGGSSWIAPLSTTDTFFAPGTYVYRTTFDLTGLDPASARIDGTFAVDNSVTDVILNGTSLGIQGGAYWAMTNFAITSHFVDGVNTMEFVVLNSGGSAGPTGLRVRLAGTANPLVAPDADPPVIVGAFDRALSWQGAPIDLATLGITATDAVDGAVPVSLSPASVGLGTHTATATAQDSKGNVASASFVVRVVDVTAPLLAGPAEPVVFEWENAPLALTAALLGVSATDDVDAAPSVSVAPDSVGLGEHTVTATATDAAGNASTLAVLVRVADTVAPQILALSATPNVLDARWGRMADVAVTALVADAGDAAPRTKVVGVEVIDAADTWWSKSGPDWTITGDLTLQLRAERSGKGGGRVYLITVESRDASGNVSTATVEVAVPHDQKDCWSFSSGSSFLRKLFTSFRSSPWSGWSGGWSRSRGHDEDEDDDRDDRHDRDDRDDRHDRD